jgi:hypothetical protein
MSVDPKKKKEKKRKEKKRKEKKRKEKKRKKERERAEQIDYGPKNIRMKYPGRFGCYCICLFINQGFY